MWPFQSTKGEEQEKISEKEAYRRHILQQAIELDNAFHALAGRHMTVEEIFQHFLDTNQTISLPAVVIFIFKNLEEKK